MINQFSGETSSYSAFTDPEHTAYAEPPTSFADMIMFAVSEQNDSRSPDSEATVETAPLEEPDAPGGNGLYVLHESLLEEGFSGMKSERLLQALESFNLACELNSNCFRALYHRGIVLEKLGRKDEAYADFKRVVNLTPYASEDLLLRTKAFAELDSLIETKPKSKWQSFLDAWRSILSDLVSVAQRWLRFV